ncbi:hypothetical protein Purlil1_14021 [Purpureocillium lilacinum]|uniref:Uncharacterized protein n=1 Tax=Purpureocillium lilacinum TaxID=33203 RepID=A0ABR0BCK6_PURLI|nr:hypothetical protein Purlil1_14021 [Purpureocillium lilacinum]
MFGAPVPSPAPATQSKQQKAAAELQKASPGVEACLGHRIRAPSVASAGVPIWPAPGQRADPDAVRPRHFLPVAEGVKTNHVGKKPSLTCQKRSPAQGTVPSQCHCWRSTNPISRLWLDLPTTWTFDSQDGLLRHRKQPTAHTGPRQGVCTPVSADYTSPDFPGYFRDGYGCMIDGFGRDGHLVEQVMEERIGKTNEWRLPTISHCMMAPSWMANGGASEATGTTLLSAVDYLFRDGAGKVGHDKVIEEVALPLMTDERAQRPGRSRRGDRRGGESLGQTRYAAGVAPASPGQTGPRRTLSA